MSKHHLRHDKTCLNCGTEVPDRYCPRCGQENLEPRESVGHLFIHFINDITHFDGKFFSTIKLLFTKPGFLSAEYMKGRRAAYLNPIRMFLFISFALFFVELATYDYIEDEEDNAVVTAQDSIANAKAKQLRDSSDNVVVYNATPSVTLAENEDSNSQNKRGNLRKRYGTLHRYDSIQNALPSSERDNFVIRWANRKVMAFGEYADKHPEVSEEDIEKDALHSAPKALFVSIPIFALLLWLLYVRSRKNYYFVAHAIFTVHIYCALYLYIIVTKPFEIFSNPVTDSIYEFLWIPPAVYIYLAMKHFYRQNHFKTAIKYLLLVIPAMIIMVVFMVGVYLNSMTTISQGGH